MTLVSDYYAQLLHFTPPKARGSSKLPQLALVVDGWAGVAEAGKKGLEVTLELYECDQGEEGRADAATARNQLFAKLKLTLVPNPKADGTAANPAIAIKKVAWADKALKKQYASSRSKADFALWLTAKEPLYLNVPMDDILEEGDSFEIGFKLYDDQGNGCEKLSIANGHVAQVVGKDWLKALKSIPGRFDDPKRDASKEKDGELFDQFLPSGKTRRELIREMLGLDADDKTDKTGPLTSKWLMAARKEKNADLRTTDILKAYLVVHDVGAGIAVLADRRFLAEKEATKKGAVHGFINRKGVYAATWDFSETKNGTVYEFLTAAGKKHFKGRMINIECVPDVELVKKGKEPKDKDKDGDPYLTMGWEKKGTSRVFYKYTAEAIDCLADIYVFASARARHLLTITAHKETDRNLARSVLYDDYPMSVWKSPPNKYLLKARDRPQDYHGDPNGFDFQTLYDKITEKLNALGGAQLPAGTRYGIHPRRITKEDGLDITNGSHHLHEFPHQSDPEVKPLPASKKRKPGWWK